MSHRTVRSTFRPTFRHALAGAALLVTLALAGPAQAQDVDAGESPADSAEASFLELAWDRLTDWIAAAYPATDVQVDTADAGWIIDPDG